jgi:murein L,D-transpeptidase YafK
MATRVFAPMLPFLTLLLFTAAVTPAPTLCAPAESLPDEADEVSVRPWTDWEYEGPSRSSARVAAAREAKTEVVNRLFQEAGTEFPPQQLLFRVFKEEELLEVWAADDREGELVHVTSYAICAASGRAGPKRRQGDGQVPEGFYTIDAFNEHSSYYLSMRISYPNESDRILGHPRHPGNAIMIHGNCVSIGCLALSDERMQEVWLMAAAMREARQRIHVHIFPSRDLDGLIATMPNLELRSFWENLREGFRIFEADRRPPRVRVEKNGRYRFTSRVPRP